MQEAKIILAGKSRHVKLGILRRFNQKWAKDINSDCHLWSASRDAAGYGHFSMGHQNTVKAHRVSWELNYGLIPPGMHVLHRCDNPPCVNPNHLFLGTHLDNMRDCVSKGRRNFSVGESRPEAKVSERDVLDIRASTEILKTCAGRYGLSLTQIWRIRKCLNWRHVK